MVMSFQSIDTLGITKPKVAGRHHIGGGYFRYSTVDALILVKRRS